MTLTKFARCRKENSEPPLLSLSCCPQHSQFLPRSDGLHSLQAWPAMRSTASGSPILLLLQTSSPIGAGSRVEVVDTGEYKANRLTALGARIFFPFHIEIGARIARQSFSYFVNRQSKSFKEIVSFSLFHFLDSFQTLKAQKDKKTLPRRKSEKQRATADRRRRPLGLVTHRQKALDARSSTISKTHQSHGE